MDKLTYIEVGKEKYPIKCDNLVLQQIQEEFGSVRLFEMALIGYFSFPTSIYVNLSMLPSI